MARKLEYPPDEFIPHTFPIQAGSKKPIGPWKEVIGTRKLIREWHLKGFNLALRTGRNSGILVVDVDAHHADCATWTHTDGPCVKTASGGYHYYFKWPGCGGNSAGKVGKHIDTRGEGGYVVLPNSIIPDLGSYRWVKRVTEELPDCPLLWLPRKPSAPRPKAEHALMREVHGVRTAVEGERNGRLNLAAFNLGQLVDLGELDRPRVVQELTEAATIAGLDDSEIAPTIQSGFAGATEKPRTPRGAHPDRATETYTGVATLTPPPPPGLDDVIYIPGYHPNHRPPYHPVKQGTHEFCDEVIRALPNGIIYRRGGIVGEVVDRQFVPVDGQRMRTIVDKNLELWAGKAGRSDEPPTKVFRSCGHDLGKLLVAYAQTQGGVRELKFLAHHPAYVSGTDNRFRLAERGWDHHAQTYVTCEIPEPLPLKEAREVLDDVLIDFPFKETADKANFIGLMLTPILRPAIGEPVPFHLIGSPIERSGKTKLAEIVLGCGVLGDPTAAMQIGVREEEIEKRITSLLLSGVTVAHLDNMREFTDSASLASLLTSNVWMGRVLGGSVLARIPNTLCIVGTGNNVHATGEIAKRTVPIMLQPDTESPELRTNFAHPQLKQYVTENRPRIQAALIGLVENWIAKGKPEGPVSFGGFERWAWMVGGIMRAAGYPEWMDNTLAWRGVADDFGAEARLFVKEWKKRHGLGWTAAGDLYNIAVEKQILEPGGTTEAGRRTSFGKTLSKLENSRRGGYIIVSKGRGAKRCCKLQG